jgi:hypothetical protein
MPPCRKLIDSREFYSYLAGTQVAFPFRANPTEIDRLFAAWLPGLSPAGDPADATLRQKEIYA